MCGWIGGKTVHSRVGGWVGGKTVHSRMGG